MRIDSPPSISLPILVLSAALGVVSMAYSGEPRYNGKALSKWLTLYQNREEGTPPEHQAESAVRAIGTNALPYLMKWITGDDLEQAMRAKLAFKILGPAGAPAVPMLAPLLTSTNELVAAIAGPALASIGAPAVPVVLNALTNKSYKISLNAILALPELGTNARPAIPFLVQDLQHPNHFYRERAADALGRLHIEPDYVIPALTALLNDPSPAARFHALSGLAEFGPTARPAAPAILRIMNEDEDLRSRAKEALSQIAPEILTNAPAR